MLHLLHPAALWTLAALALPLAIHLRRPPPRTVRLGSLRFLENVPRRPLRNLRWRELLLLGTRLGLLAALALLLAEPRWTVALPAGPRRWALLDPTGALADDSLGRWRAARASGDELRRLVPGFPVVADESSPAAADAGHAIAPDLWSLLREADAELPPGSTLEVFSPARLAALRGTRPALAHCRVEWVQTPDVASGVAHVWVLSALEKRLVAGRSDARSTTFTVGAPGEPLVFPAHEDERWRTDPGDTAPGSTHVLSRENDPANATDRWVVDVPPPALSVLILHDAEHVADARYVEAAVRAAGAEGRAVNLQNREITPDAENAATTDWTFWLSARPMPEGFAAREGEIARYAGGEAVAADDWIVAPFGDAADGVRLWRRAVLSPQSPAGVAWWRDGRGDPLLTYAHPAAGERWELFTRFDPAWTDLPRTTALPAWIRALLFPGAVAPSPADPIQDRRLADPSQGLPSETPAVSIPTLAPADQSATELRWLFWTLAMLLFAVERVLSLLPQQAPVQRAAAARTEPVAAASR